MGRILKNQRGFSLVELITVVAIIGVLAVIAIPQYQKFRMKAFQAEAKTLLTTLHQAEHVFYLEYDAYHSSMNVIGFAPAGRTRYNVGFGAEGTITALNSPEFPPNSFNSKNICGGAFGSGAEDKCDMFVPTPDISAVVTVVGNAYYASAVAFESSLVSQATPAVKMLNIAVDTFLGDSAHAVYTPPPEIDPNAGIYVGVVTGYDGWVIDNNNNLRQGQFTNAAPAYTPPPGGCFKDVCHTDGEPGQN